MRASALFAVVSICASAGLTAEASGLGVPVMPSAGLFTFVHHEASENPPPAQMLGTLPAEDWPVTNWYKQSVYDLSNKKIGQIADVLVDHDGKNTAVLIGVRGVLGTREKYVAVPFDNVRFRKKDNSRYPVVNTTKEALKSAPGYLYDRNAGRWAPENAPSSVGQPQR
jgi:sporulation protein YlmC with PRC-barrel domain